MKDSLHWRRQFFGAALFLVFFALLSGPSGCAMGRGTDDPPINEVWHVVYLAGHPIPRLPNGRVPALRLDGESVRVSGFTGCNRLGGSYLLAGDSLEFIGLTTTRMACSQPGASVEMVLMQNLESVSRWRRKGKELELLDSKGALLIRLAPAEEEKPSS